MRQLRSKVHPVVLAPLVIQRVRRRRGAQRRRRGGREAHEAKARVHFRRLAERGRIFETRLQRREGAPHARRRAERRDARLGVRVGRVRHPRLQTRPRGEHVPSVRAGAQRSPKTLRQGTVRVGLD